MTLQRIKCTLILQALLLFALCFSMAEGAKLPFVPNLLQSATISGAFAGVTPHHQWVKSPFKIFLDKEGQRITIRAWEPIMDGKLNPSLFSQVSVDFKKGKGIEIFQMNATEIVHCNGFSPSGRIENIFKANPFESATFAGYSMSHGSLVSKFKNVALSFYSGFQMNLEVHLDAFAQQPVFMEEQTDDHVEILSYVAGVPDSAVFEVPQGLKCEGFAQRSSFSLLNFFRK